MNRPTKITSVVAVLIVLVCSVVLAYRAGWLWESADQQKVSELKLELAATMKDQKSWIPSQKSSQMWQQVSKLPEQYRKQFQKSAAKMAMREMERRVDDYLKMTPTERKQELDKRIAEMEQMRKQFEERRKSQATSTAADGGGVPTAGNEAKGKGPRNGFAGGLSGILDNTTPQFRAKMTVFMVDLQTRRTELGLPPMGPR
jgi:hypothetical protein